MKRKIIIGIFILTLIFTLTGCVFTKNKSTNSTSTSTASTGLLNSSDIFTKRDLEQEVDTSSATKYTVMDGEDITISKEGTYVISGTSKNTTIIVDVADEEKVNLVLSDLDISNDNTPCIYVKNTDKVFVTVTNTNNLKVTNTFTSDSTTNTDAVIFSKDDIVINGTGTINITSTANGITSKDDLKITGSTINITCSEDALEANTPLLLQMGILQLILKKMAYMLNIVMIHQ